MTSDDNSSKHSSNGRSEGGGGSVGSGDTTRDNSADAAGGGVHTAGGDSSAEKFDAQSSGNYPSEDDFETCEWPPVQAWSEVRNPDGSVAPRQSVSWGNSPQWNAATGGGSGWNNGGSQQWSGGIPGGGNSQGQGQ
ncbi:hypothetical protein [Corynebacterium kroppenstedtii]|uniref:Uncharacterized protein n=2 Tax=Corynebacterium kroppenstedtii TaxID=161879 RepID=A0A2W5USZ6_9CORY|nr:hypothetical protein [Corynebacterium kroppenstedtii]PZR06414.1 MAG: hypothetical protein DI525_01160 [Corynebacterium kroppenstedtii]